MKKYSNNIVKIFVSLLLLYILTRDFSYEEIYAVLRSDSIAGVFVVIFLYGISTFINAVKWHILLPQTRLYLLVSLSFKAQFYSTILPGQMFGEMSKISSFRKRNDDLLHITASVIFDKITGILSQIIIGTIGLFFSKTIILGEEGCVLIVTVFLTVVFMCLLDETYTLRVVKLIMNFIGEFSDSIAERIYSFYSSWCMFSGKTLIIKSVLCGIINQMLGVVSVYYLSLQLGLQVSFADYCWMLSLMSLILLLPISFAGIGLRDTSLASMLSIMNVSLVNSLVISMTMLLAQFFVAVIGWGYVMKQSDEMGERL